MFDTVSMVVFVLVLAALIAAFWYDAAHNKSKAEHDEYVRRMARRIDGGNW
jgi:hypothetical protein